MSIDAHDVERIATRVVELLRAEHAPATLANVRFVDAAEVARVLGVTRDWVYLHARELGAIRLGGPHGRRRYDLRGIHERFTAIEVGELTRPRRTPRRAYGSDAVPPKMRKTPESGRATLRTSPARHQEGNS